MAGSVIGALRVVLGLDSAAFETGAKSAEGRAKLLSSTMMSSFSKIGGAADALKITLAGLGSALALKELAGAAQRALDYTDAIADLADRTGASTKLIQEFRYAAQMSGSSVETADEALGKFAKTLGLAQSGSDEQVKRFRELGVTSRDFDGAFRQTLDGLAKLPTVQERNSTALAIFGKSAATLTALMGEGTAGFDELAQSAASLGIVLRDDVIRNAGVANDKLDTLKMIMDAQFASAVAANADKIAMLAQVAADTFTAITDMASKEAGDITAAFAGLHDVFAPMVDGANLSFGKIEARAGILRSLIGNILGGIDNIRNIRIGVANAQTAADNALNPFGKPKQLTPYVNSRGEFEKGYDRAVAENEKQGLLNLGRQWNPGLYGGSRTRGSLPTQGNAEAAGASRKADADQKRAAAEAKRAAEKARRDEERYRDQLEQVSNEHLRAIGDLTTEVEDRYSVEQQQNREETAARIAKIGADKDLTDAQKQQLIDVVAETGKLRDQAILRDRTEALQKRALEAAQARGENEADILQAQAGLARTAKERGRIELLILDNQFKQLRLAQQAIIDSATASQQEKDLAAERLKTLGVLEGYARDRANRDNAGPLQQYFDSLPRNADELNEAYQHVAADGLKNLNDGLADAITGSRSLGEVFSGIADQIIADLARIAIQQAIIKPLEQSLTGGGGGFLGKLGSFLGLASKGAGTSITGDIATPSSVASLGGGGLPQLANGGWFGIGGRGGIDRNVLSINGIPRAMVSADERVHVNSIRDRGSQEPTKFVFYADEGATFQPRVQQISGEQGVAIQRASNRTSAVRARQSLGRPR